MAEKGFNSIVGGQNNTISYTGNDDSKPYAFIGGGCGNTISGYAGGNGSAIVAGINNQANGEHYQFIGGGAGNTVTNCHSTLVGGLQNCITGNAGFIGAGGYNKVTSTYSSIVGGTLNTASSACSFIGGGDTNYVTGTNAAIIAGELNYASGRCSLTSGYKNRNEGNFTTVICLLYTSPSPRDS